MPTYEYRCDKCDANFDVVQSFHDDPLTACPTCGSAVRKVFGSVGIVFKGSGFYKTDNRSGSGRTSGSSTSGDSASSDTSSAPAASTDAKATTNTESSSKPAPAKESKGSTGAKPSTPANT